MKKDAAQEERQREREREKKKGDRTNGCTSATLHFLFTRVKIAQVFFILLPTASFSPLLHFCVCMNILTIVNRANGKSDEREREKEKASRDSTCDRKESLYKSVC